MVVPVAYIVRVILVFVAGLTVRLSSSSGTHEVGTRLMDGKTLTIGAATSVFPGIGSAEPLIAFATIAVHKVVIAQWNNGAVKILSISGTLVDVGVDQQVTTAGVSWPALASLGAHTVILCYEAGVGTVYPGRCQALEIDSPSDASLSIGADAEFNPDAGNNVRTTEYIAVAKLDVDMATVCYVDVGHSSNHLKCNLITVSNLAISYGPNVDVNAEPTEQVRLVQLDTHKDLVCYFVPGSGSAQCSVLTSSSASLSAGNSTIIEEGEVEHLNLAQMGVDKAVACYFNDTSHANINCKVLVAWGNRLISGSVFVANTGATSADVYLSLSALSTERAILCHGSLICDCVVCRVLVGHGMEITAGADQGASHVVLSDRRCSSFACLAVGGLNNDQALFCSPDLAGANSVCSVVDTSTCSMTPPSYQAACPGGTRTVRLQVPGTTGTSNNTDSEGPFLKVAGAATPGIDGVYEYRQMTVNETCETYQLYAKGTYRLLWEPGPQVIYGLRWILFGGHLGSRAAPLYYKYTSDAMLGWRSANTPWAVGVGGESAPQVDSTQPEDFLVVTGAGESSIDGVFVRQSNNDYPEHLGYKAYFKGNYTLLWEPGPQIIRGRKWILYSVGHAGISQEYPFYSLLSWDGGYGYNATWTVKQGAYPPPRVNIIQTKGCLRCPPGSYSENLSQACLRCPEGGYSLGGADACTICANGTFASSIPSTSSVRKLPSCGSAYVAAGRGACTMAAAGASRCELCIAGHYSIAGSGFCEPCPPGYFSEAQAGNCTTCPSGTWSGQAAPECTQCPAGRANEYEAQASPNSCFLCAPGKYSTPAGQSACTNCSAGSYSGTSGLSACSLCAVGSYSATPGISLCSLCPNKSGEQGRTVCWGQEL